MNSRLFKTLCERMNSQNEHLLLHIESKMAVKGRVLSRLVKQGETKLFLQKNNSRLTEFIWDEMLMSKLSYLADILCHLNKLDICLQSFCTNIFAQETTHTQSKTSRHIGIALFRMGRDVSDLKRFFDKCEC